MFVKRKIKKKATAGGTYRRFGDSIARSMCLRGLQPRAPYFHVVLLAPVGGGQQLEIMNDWVLVHSICCGGPVVMRSFGLLVVLFRPAI
ncbi:MAG: hypothetical protein AAB467_00100 [Patescibacteria group bacterium]